MRSLKATQRAFLGSLSKQSVRRALRPFLTLVAEEMVREDFLEEEARSLSFWPLNHHFGCIYLTDSPVWGPLALSR